MKKLLIALLAAAGLAVGASAEGTGTKYNAGSYNVYKASDAISDATGQNVTDSPVILHKVIISSPAFNVDVSTNATFQVLQGQGAGASLRAEIDLSTQSVASGATEYTFDIALSSALSTDYSGNVTTGKVNLIYSRGNHPASPDGYRVWSSTFMAADTAVHNITAGPVLLHKIIVLKKGTGTSVLNVYDSRQASSPTTTRRKAAIDLTDAAREYTYNIAMSSGITVEASGAGTVVPSYIVLYKKNASADYETWSAYFASGTVTTANIVTGSGYVFGGVVNGDSVSASKLTVYDSNAVASGQIAIVNGGASFDRKMYDVTVSSGITVSSSGNGLYTILYKRRNQ